MENIHSDFFEIVLQTFNMDREKIYRVAFDDPILRKKQDLIVEEVDKISYGKIDPETLQGKKDILRAILLNNIVDRKSTRLNSSHVAISYAVFCLKKKKKA